MTHPFELQLSQVNTIHIERLELETVIGVPEAERGSSQRLTVSLALTPWSRFEEMRDEIERTIDYAAVCARAQAVARERPRKLIETLAADLAAMVLAEFPCQRVELELRKFILPQTEYVAVRLMRQRG